MPDGPAIGRSIRLYPTDWDAAFVHRVQEGEALALPEAGFYTGTIVAVKGRARRPVQVELREFDPVEAESFCVDLACERLILEEDEDGWMILPASGTAAAGGRRGSAAAAALAPSKRRPVRLGSSRDAVE
jgi:hypothetical protein